VSGSIRDGVTWLWRAWAKRTSDSRLDPVVSVSAAYGPETERSPEQPMRQGVFVVAVWQGIRLRERLSPYGSG
jgi:hypothetical protein